MLEQVGVELGMRVLEGGGCNAALLVELVGDREKLVRAGVDFDIVECVRICLKAGGYDWGEVVEAVQGHGKPQVQKEDGRTRAWLSMSLLC